MKNQTLVLLAIAGACGLVAMLGVKKYLDQQDNRDVKPTVTVLTAMAPIKQGDPLNTTNTQFVTVDEDACPEGVVTDLEQIKDRSVKVPRGTGDWILLDQLSAPGQIGATVLIPKGYRVQTIPVDATTHHSGMLQPGNRIDVFVTFQGRDEETGERVNKAVPVLEYVEVFAVDSAQYGVDQSGENDKARNISLLVTPEQSQKVMVARKLGDISTVLRSSEDKESLDVAEVDDGSLTGLLSSSGVDETTSMASALPAFELPSFGDGFDMMKNLTEAAPGGGSGPVGEKDNGGLPEDIRTIEIFEKGGVRLQYINTKTNIPVTLPGVPDGRSGGISIPPRGAGGAAEGKLNGLDALEEEVSDLLEEAF